MLIDTHCHLNLAAFNSDVETVIERAKRAGVKRMVVVGVDLKSSQRAVKLAARYERVWATVGYHPHHVQAWQGYKKNSVKTEIDEIVAQLKDLTAHEKVVGLGEIGLDYYEYQQTRYSNNQVTAELKKWQELLLIAQLNLAVEAGLPVVLHTRNSMRATIRVVEKYAAKLSGGVWHCFGGSLAEAQEVIRKFANFYIGIDGNVSYHQSKFDTLRQVAGWVPLRKLVVETDAPYLTPEPRRGKRCEPADVRLVAEYLAELRREKYKNLEIQTGRNGQALFAKMR